MLQKIKHCLPFLNRKYNEFLSFGGNLGDPPGSYGSPVISIPEIIKRENFIFNRGKEIRGIDLNEAGQLELLGFLKGHYTSLPFREEPSNDLRYYYNNQYFPYFDSISLFGMINHFKPGRIIEIGSGFSSAVMLDTNERFFDNSINLTFIEPFPERLKSLLRANDKIELHASYLQDMNTALFDQLDRNDILFIDTSHVVKVGSELNHILFEILPSFRPGVIVHFHDIFYPFEYPKSWVLNDKRSWNEIYFIQSFLMYNKAFKILLFNSFIGAKYIDWLQEHMPLCARNTGGSFWIVKND